MATQNTSIQVADLDFVNIKTNFTNYLKNAPNSPFKDYNFTGSALSTLLDLLTYNTQYNAFYLNQVANEMFLDTALQRSSVVSHAKLLNYVPKSAVAPTAIVNVVVSGVTSPSLTLPSYSKFLSEAIDGVNFPFVSTDNYTVNTVSNTATFNNVIIKQGIPVNYNFTYSANDNAKSLFTLPDSNIDTSSLKILVYPNSSSTDYDIFNLADSMLTLDNTSKVYFLQEGISGNYEIYFGDGVLGQALLDGSRISVFYVTTLGTLSHGANNFVLTSSLGLPVNVSPISQSSLGSDKESIESIKFQATKSFTAQNRAVTKDDYITAIQQNTLGFNFDAVNVWGGEENIPPAYGKVFVSVKPSGAYSLTTTQKQALVEQVIKPISVMTVQPTIVDPDYTYVKLNLDVFYDPSLTTKTSQQIKSGVLASIQSLFKTTLNTFNSTLNPYEILDTVQNYDKSIITGDFKVQLQKKFFPNLVNATTYKLYFGTPLEKSSFLSGVSSSPSISYVDPANVTNLVPGVYIEELPSSTNSLESVTVLNPGFGYQSAPIVTVLGDGIGATAHATLYTDGSISSIVVDNPGSGYSAAIVTITPQPNDTTGQNAAGIVNLTGRLGTLRLYYNDIKNVKTILNPNIGTIDYANGLITLNDFLPTIVDNSLGQFTVTGNPASSIISSSFNRVITYDEYDTNAINVNVIAKNS